MKALRALASEVVALQKQARALGMFADDRELLACAKCGMHEDVTFSGFLITVRPAALDEDTGLRFKELAGAAIAARFAARPCAMRMNSFR